MFCWVNLIFETTKTNCYPTENPANSTVFFYKIIQRLMVYTAFDKDKVDKYYFKNITLILTCFPLPLGKIFFMTFQGQSFSKIDFWERELPTRVWELNCIFS